MTTRVPRGTIDQPQEGHFRLRLVRGGPWVAARIFRPPAIDPAFGDPIDRWPHLQAEIDGIGDVPVDRVWLFGHPIDAREYAFLCARSAYARAHAPDMPDAQPDKPIDPLTTPIPF